MHERARSRYSPTQMGSGHFERTDLRSVMFVSLVLAQGPGFWANHWTRIKALKRATPRLPGCSHFPKSFQLTPQPSALRRLQVHIRTHCIMNSLWTCLLMYSLRLLLTIALKVDSNYHTSPGESDEVDYMDPCKAGKCLYDSLCF